MRIVPCLLPVIPWVRIPSLTNSCILNLMIPTAFKTEDGADEGTPFKNMAMLKTGRMNMHLFESLAVLKTELMKAHLSLHLLLIVIATFLLPSLIQLAVILSMLSSVAVTSSSW